MSAVPNDASTLNPAGGYREWRTHIIAIVIGLAILVGLFWSTYASMVAIWERSETFAHGYLIFPIALFLVWRIRKRLALAQPTIDYRALVVLLGLGVGWTLASLVDVAVVRQFSAVGMIPALVWLLVGWSIAKSMMFPLLFVLFAVPIGEGLILPMMEFTADFTIGALRMTGIPVYREGLFFSLPSGNWSVVEGCSGVRYLIASITLGFLYAYLTYRSYYRRAFFIVLSVVVPIIGNGLRAYMIVMIGHLSSMKYATGVDHLVYGWVFFGLIMMVLFWVGSYWRDDHVDEASEPRPAANGGTATTGVFAALALGVLSFAVWPVWASYLSAENEQRLNATTSIEAPAPADGWTLRDSLTEWRPEYQGPTTEANFGYRSANAEVGVHLAYYAGQSQDAELVNTQNVLVRQKDEVWSERYKKTRDITIGQETVTVYESWMKSSQESYLAWHWYWLNGTSTVNPYEAKVREAIGTLLGQPRDGAGIVIFTADQPSPDTARQTLQAFVNRMLPSIEAAVRNARPEL
ncbi:MAG: exosortase A [Pseudomonadota bacterium]